MRFWDKYRKLVTGLAVSVLGVVALHLIVVGHVTDAKEKAKSELEADIEKDIKPRRKGVFEVAKATEDFRRSNEDLARKLAGLMELVEIQFHPWVKIPQEYSAGARPGSYFVYKHAEMSRDLYTVCVKASPQVELSDPDLGFKDILKKPLDPKGAEENLKRLSIVTRVVKLLAESGVSEIVGITHDEPDKAGPEGYPEIMLEYSVRIVVRTRLDPLMKFLHQVRQQGNFFLVVRGLEVNGYDPYARRTTRDGEADERMLSVTLTAAGMRFLTEEERKAAEKASAQPAPTRVRLDSPLGH